MASFTIRVEMRNASSEDYTRLHEAMEAKGYSREIQNSVGTVFHLPTAEYVAEKNLSVRSVRDEVSKIAAAIRDNPLVLVTEASDRSWLLVKK